MKTIRNNSGLYRIQLADESKEVAETAAQFLASNNKAISQLVLTQIVDKPEVALSLVLQLVKKAANAVVVPCVEFAHIKFLENEDANRKRRLKR